MNFIFDLDQRVFFTSQYKAGHISRVFKVKIVECSLVHIIINEVLR